MNNTRILLFLVIAIFTACKNKQSEIESILKEWIGKTIVFPDNISPYIIKKDTLKPVVNNNNDKKYTILLYTDSTDCISCKLRIDMWKSYIEQIGDKVNFMFYFKTKDDEKLISLLKRKRFNYPVFIDKDGEIDKLNHFPLGSMFQCFVLDIDNKVLSIGNPTINQNIWELYKNIVINKVSIKPLVTTIAPEQTGIELKNLQTNKITEAVFTLTNTGSHPLLIQMVDASCGCTVPEWEKQPISAGKSTEIKVKITPEEKGYFNKTITVYCNTEEGRILLKISGIVDN
jgi:hypothetical protein